MFIWATVMLFWRKQLHWMFIWLLQFCLTVTIIIILPHWGHCDVVLKKAFLLNAQYKCFNIVPQWHLLRYYPTGPLWCYEESNFIGCSMERGRADKLLYLCLVFTSYQIYYICICNIILFWRNIDCYNKRAILYRSRFSSYS